MSIDRHLGFPNTLLQLVQACTFHPAVVKDVKDPTGSGRVQVECQSVYGGSKSNWIQCTSNSPAPDDKNRKQTGLWNPAKPGSYGYVFFPGGNLLKPCFMAGSAHMNAKGNPGSKS
jgi:hypothetical protein